MCGDSLQERVQATGGDAWGDGSLAWGRELTWSEHQSCARHPCTSSFLFGLETQGPQRLAKKLCLRNL